MIGDMNFTKEKIQMILTMMIISAYLYLVIAGKANVEGFVALAMYSIKKFLDIAEKN